MLRVQTDRRSQGESFVLTWITSRQPRYLTTKLKLSPRGKLGPGKLWFGCELQDLKFRIDVMCFEDVRNESDQLLPYLIHTVWDSKIS